ncbi:hypothetical protein [Gordonia sp. KTR9]|uniref:hypothetical protein n=1 Tax=Gordonia sp. KTR9 TaxID=337191 RepID=UPI00027DE382|nr:hypothetical protein [Gordonia sp. KTR9]AFR51411.1 hypothetical protein KTR9_4952 [Gordonia sp. KTR9]
MSGLDDMAQARQKRARARSMPPPRHQAPAVSAAPATAPEPAPAPEQPDTTANAPAAVQVTSPTKKKQPAAPAPPPPRAASTTGRTVGPSTIYFDEPTDDWLEEVSIAGRRTKPRIDSRSAIARYAVRKLMNEMTPEQVIEAIRAESAATAHTKPGRPRH